MADVNYTGYLIYNSIKDGEQSQETKFVDGDCAQFIRDGHLESALSVNKIFFEIPLDNDLGKIKYSNSLENIKWWIDYLNSIHLFSALTVIGIEGTKLILSLNLQKDDDKTLENSKQYRYFSLFEFSFLRQVWGNPYYFTILLLRKFINELDNKHNLSIMQLFFISYIIIYMEEDYLSENIDNFKGWSHYFTLIDTDHTYEIDRQDYFPIYNEDDILKIFTHRDKHDPFFKITSTLGSDDFSINPEYYMKISFPYSLSLKLLKSSKNDLQKHFDQLFTTKTIISK